MTLTLTSRRRTLARSILRCSSSPCRRRRRSATSCSRSTAATGGALGRALVAPRLPRRARRDAASRRRRAAASSACCSSAWGRPTDRGSRAAARRRDRRRVRRNRLGVGRLAFFAGALTADEVEAAGLGLIAGAWDFKELKTPPPADEQRAPLEEATILAADVAARDAGLRGRIAIGEGHSLARRLGMLPGNVCTPDYLADTARDIAQAARHEGRRCSVARRWQREKMGSFLCVAQGTTQDPKLIALEYREGRRTRKPVALVGKGLCFDSGGISIKPAQGMEWMKFDMCGAAGVLGAMEAIGRLELPVNVVGLIGSTTNMPSGEAVKPGDVVQASNGKYIEIINTDAEGRLVLADVLSYAKRFSPAAVIDAATLTGACVIALGHTATGVHGQRRGAGAGSARRGQACGRAGLAAAAVGRVQGADQVGRRGHQELRRTAGGHDHRRDVPEGVRRRLSMGAPRHRGNGVHRIGSRHGAARSDRRAGGNVRGVRARAGALSVTRAACCCALRRPRPAWPGPFCTGPLAARRFARHDSEAARHDARHPDSGARRLAAARQSRETAIRSKRAAKVERDTIKAPFAHAELPIDIGDRRGGCTGIAIRCSRPAR